MIFDNNWLENPGRINYNYVIQNHRGAILIRAYHITYMYKNAQMGFKSHVEYQPTVCDKNKLTSNAYS